MRLQPEKERQKQIQAELSLYPSTEQDYSFGAGFISDHQSLGSWFSSGLTGLALSKGTGDGTDCNNNNILDSCEDTYQAGFKSGTARADLNKDGEENILDVVQLVENILK